MESVTLKGAKAALLPIIMAIVLNGGTFNINFKSKTTGSETNRIGAFQEVNELQQYTLNYLIDNEFDVESISYKNFMIKHKNLLKATLNREIEITITGEKDLLAPYILELIYENNPKVKIKFDTSKINEDDLRILGAVIELENGGSVERGDRDGIRCGLLTGSVPLNRVSRSDWPNTLYDVIHQKGQYASNTVKKLYTVKIPKKVNQLAEYLLIFGSICPEGVVFQSQNPSLGKKRYEAIKTSSGYEYFAYGDD